MSNGESPLSEEEVSGEESRPKSQEKVTECTRGCYLVLVNLAKTYREVGRHCWPTIMYRQNQYPSPVKEMESNSQLYKNITGEYVVKASYTFEYVPNFNILHFSAQNQWLRDNIMDAFGNYLFCAHCLVAYLKIGRHRLHRQ